MKIATKPITPECIKNEIDYIISFFQENKSEKIYVCYGWKCEAKNQYKDIKLKIEDLKSFIENSEKNNIFILGKSDLYIADSKKENEFLLCHESDIHFESKNSKMISKVRKHWKVEGYECYKI